MKLRNKKTGEIISKIDVSRDHEGIWVMENKPRFYRTLAELNADWEDYDEKAEKEAVEYLEQILDLLNKILEKRKIVK